MVKQVIWTNRAIKDRRNILEYWIKRNKSKVYSLKLNQIFINTIELISRCPKIGKNTNNPEIRIKIVKDYFFTYRETEVSIEIMTIWDSRQDSGKFEKRINVEKK